MIYCPLVHIKRKNDTVVIKWDYKWTDKKDMIKTRLRLSELYEGDALFMGWYEKND
jgi:hypothetical protein